MKTLQEFLSESASDEFVGIHYSHVPNLSKLHGSMSGTGIRGAEQERLQQTTDPRIKKRVYFYHKPATGGFPKPEVGLGSHAYEMRSNAMYDASKPNPYTVSIRNAAEKYTASGEHPANAFERAVVDHGFIGYHTAMMGVVLNHDPKVSYVGNRVATKSSNVTSPTSKERSISDAPANKAGEHESDLLTAQHYAHIRQHKSEIESIAPSFRMEFSRAVVKTQHVEALKKNFNDAGLNI